MQDVRCSPTKPCGKGSKRKQDDIDEEEADQHSWVEALTQELTDEDQSVDPDYEVYTSCLYILFVFKGFFELKLAHYSVNRYLVFQIETVPV